MNNTCLRHVFLAHWVTSESVARGRGSHMGNIMVGAVATTDAGEHDSDSSLSKVREN